VNEARIKQLPPRSPPAAARRSTAERPKDVAGLTVSQWVVRAPQPEGPASPPVRSVTGDVTDRWQRRLRRRRLPTEVSNDVDTLVGKLLGRIKGRANRGTARSRWACPAVKKGSESDARWFRAPDPSIPTTKDRGVGATQPEFKDWEGRGKPARARKRPNQQINHPPSVNIKKQKN
jgi:hypothetical protein